MNLGPRGTALIQQFESCRLAAYQDEAGVWTIGWGHTAGVKQGDTCTQAQADAWFHEDVAQHVAEVNALVKVALNQNQFDALVSFEYNEGDGRLAGSTLLTLVNRSLFKMASPQFDRWVYAGGHKSNGIIRRRAAERALFETAVV